MQQTLEQIRKQVELAIAGGSDPDAALQLIDELIVAQPEDVSSYRLRARLHGATYGYLEAWQDWRRVVALAPEDRLACLELVSVQHRYARNVAAFQLGLNIWDLAEEDTVHHATVAALQREAFVRLQHLMREYRADAEFVLAALDTWDQMLVTAPWLRYRLILSALAANPRHQRLLKAEAYFLADLACHADYTGKAKPGFFDDLSGRRRHAGTVERALAAIDACLELGADAGLLMAKAGLLVGLEYYDAAGAAYASASQLYATRIAGSSAEQQEALGAKRDEAQAMSGRCQGGRAGYAISHFEAVAEAVAKLKEFVVSHGNRASESSDATAELEESLAKWRAVVDAITQGPSAEERAKLAEIAKRLAKSTMSLVQLQPVELSAIPISALEAPVSPWLLEQAPQLTGVGLKMLTWFDNPANNRALGLQCQAQLWTDGHGASALTVETGKTAKLRRLLTAFDDGTMLITADSRGGSYTTSVPDVDSLNVDKDTPIADMAALHLARVARALAARPGLRALPLDTVPRLCDAENRMRLLKNAHRIGHGIHDIEIRGMNVAHHETYAAMLKEEVAVLIAALPVAAH